MGRINAGGPVLKRVRLNQKPTACEGRRNGMNDRSLVQVAGKRLFARFVPKYCASGIGPNGAADKCPCQQRSLRNAPRPGLGTQLVETEKHECHKVDDRKSADDVRQGEEGG